MTEEVYFLAIDSYYA